MQRATTKLRALVKAGKFLELPSAHDPITARLAESIGFKSIYSGGFVTGGSTCISEPQLTMTEQIRMTQAEWTTARKAVEDIIGLEEHYRIERETVEKLYGARKKTR